MGTYTSNYNLYMPTVGETGWGELVNGNFSTIDTTIKGLDTRLSGLESRIEGVEEVTSIIEVDENNNVTFPGSVTAIGGFLGNEIWANTIYLPFSATYNVPLLLSNNFTVIATAPAWKEATVTDTCTVRDLLLYASPIRPIEDGLLVTVTASISYSSMTGQKRLIVAYNGVQVYDSGKIAMNSTPSQFEIPNANLSDTITVTVSSYMNGANASASMMATVGIKPMGI